jgi:hypothetical protein
LVTGERGALVKERALIFARLQEDAKAIRVVERSEQLLRNIGAYIIAR